MIKNERKQKENKKKNERLKNEDDEDRVIRGEKYEQT